MSIHCEVTRNIAMSSKFLYTLYEEEFVCDEYNEKIKIKLILYLVVLIK